MIGFTVIDLIWDYVNIVVEVLILFLEKFYLFVANEIAEWTIVSNIYGNYSSIILNKVFGLSESFDFMLYYAKLKK